MYLRRWPHHRLLSTTEYCVGTADTGTEVHVYSVGRRCLRGPPRFGLFALPAAKTVTAEHAVLLVLKYVQTGVEASYEHTTLSAFKMIDEMTQLMGWQDVLQHRERTYRCVDDDHIYGIQ